MHSDQGREQFFWVIGGGLLQVPLIEEVRSLGFSVIVTDLDPDCPGRAGADFFFPINIFDVEGHLAKAAELERNGITIAGVLAAGIDAPETMARVARRLGLKGVSPEIAALVNNKAAFRAEMERLGYPVPRYRVVEQSNLSDLSRMLEDVGFPLIVKNTDSSGSRGTRIFRADDRPAILETIQQAIRVSRSKRALIEECWEGPEQTVETIFDIHGRFHRCFITDRVFDRSRGFALETGLRHPSQLPAGIQEEMYGLAERVARDLGIDVGAAKYDMMLTPEGPRIIEMTVRLSGGFDCQYLVPAATGKNVLKAAILTAIGIEFEPALLADTKGRVALSESIWPEPGRIASIKGLEDARAIPGFERIFFRHAVGDIIEPYIDCTKRFCFVIASGADGQEARRAMDAIKKCIRVETR